MLTATSYSSVIYDHRGDVMSEYHVSALLKYCHAKREHVPVNRKSCAWPIAEIPNIIYYRAVREGWANDSEAWKKWYRDPDNKYFRTSNMRY